MILDPYKTKALVFSRSRMVNLLHGDLVLPGVSICASPNLDIIGATFDSRLTFEDYLRGAVFRVSLEVSCSMSSSASRAPGVFGG